MSPKPTIIPLNGGQWLSFHGIPVELLATGSITGGAYTLSRGFSRAGSPTPPHRHSFAEAFYVLRGELEIRVGGERVRLAAGGFIHIPAGVAHQPVAVGDCDAELLVLCLPSGFDEFQREVGVPAPGADGPFATGEADFAARASAAAARYGIEMPLDDSHFTGPSGCAVRHPGEGASIGTAGDLYTFLAEAADTGGSYAFWHAVIFPGGGPPPHTHGREAEAFYLLRGELAIFDDGIRHTATAGTFIHLPRDGRHWFKNETDANAEMLILVAPAGLEAMLQSIGIPWPDRSVPVPHPSPAEIQRLLAAAGEYGIRIG